MKNIGVIGGGTMGSGIVHVSALYGFKTHILDINEELLHQCLENLKINFQRQVIKEKITQQDMENALNRIICSTNYDSLSNCDLVIEAATENQSIKEKIFKKMDVVCKENAILATNTSSISITEIANATRRPQNVIGMHFMNPVPVMKLVEVVRGKKTNDETVNQIIKLSLKWGKKPVECNDSPGFVTNRILLPMINEAIYCLMEGIATKESIDEIMKLGMGHPMGPLTLADLIGLDVCLNILNVLYKDLNNENYKPCPLLDEMVSIGNLGRKTKKGFYEY